MFFYVILIKSHLIFLIDSVILIKSPTIDIFVNLAMNSAIFRVKFSRCWMGVRIVDSDLPEMKVSSCTGRL